MRLAVFNDFRVGLVEGSEVVDVTSLLPDHLDAWPELRINWLINHWTELRQPLHDALTHAASPDFARHPVEQVTLRAVNPAPRQVLALPANFRAHLTELGDRTVTKKGRTAREQGFFLKAASSVVGAGESIQLPHGSSRRFDHECELAVVIGKTARDVARDRAMDHVFGYAALVDLTMRVEPGKFEEERTMRKSFETFTPVGPYLVTRDEVPDLAPLTSELSVNGEVRQSAPLSDLIVDVPEAIELISSVLTLFPGDIIAMGTPSGVGPVEAGDKLKISIATIGTMELSVEQHGAASPRPY